MRALPPPVSDEAPLPDLSEGFPTEARQAIEAGEHALVDLRENTVHRWYLVGGACFLLRNVALNRSGANSPAGARYNRIYATLAYAWPQLAKLDKSVRSHSIWLFQNHDLVKAWLATLPQNQRDQWTHPRTIRNHFEKRHPHTLPDKPADHRRRRSGPARAWNRQSLRDRSREDLEAMIVEMADFIAERDRHIVELEDQLTAKEKEITQLREDLAWERRSLQQLEMVAKPPGASTTVRPSGESVEVVHAVSRASQEIVPPLKFGQPDYAAWAKRVRERGEKLSAIELHWLLADNSEHFDAFECSLPGAGIALEDYINERIAALDQPNPGVGLDVRLRRR